MEGSARIARTPNGEEPVGDRPALLEIPFDQAARRLHNIVEQRRERGSLARAELLDRLLHSPRKLQREDRRVGRIVEVGLEDFLVVAVHQVSVGDSCPDDRIDAGRYVESPR